MLPFAESFGAWALATFLPALAGISVMVLVGGLASPRYSAALALGVFFWFFVDTIQGSSNLLVNEGFGGGIDQAVMVALFAVGAVLFLWSDGRLFSEPGSGAPLLAPFLVALAVGIHGFGEGSAFGSTAAQTPVTSLLAAFGGVSAGLAYALHKMIEPMMVAAVFLSYSMNHPRSWARSVKDISALALLFTLPSLAGAAAAYFVGYDATYFFALGSGTSLYAVLRLSAQVFDQPAQGTNESLKIGSAMVLGFILIYLAALLHS